MKASSLYGLQSQQGPSQGSFLGLLFSTILLSLLAGGCSIRKIAVNNLADALAQGGTTYASDEDMELVKDAAPFSLKLMESLLAETPRHRPLLLATSSGFTQYAYAFVQQEADVTEAEDLAEATRIRERARLLYLRARDYGMRGLEANHPGFGQSLRANPETAAETLKRDDVPLAYWTAAAWGSAISLSKDKPDRIAEQPVVEALIDRVLELDESFGDGAVHSFLISYEPIRQGVAGDYALRCREHFERAMELSGGFQAAPLIALAEAVSLARQDRREFEALLNRALDVDTGVRPEWRLENLVMQRRARWLLSMADDLFLDTNQ